MVVSVHGRRRASWHLIAAWVAICAVCAIAASASASPAKGEQRSARRDLAADESMGGHTLARHVGRTDADLADRLRRERQISAASTYTDRPTAERAVGAALASSARQLAAWENRSGRRPNLVLHYTERGGQPLGRSLSRGQSRPVPAFRALSCCDGTTRLPLSGVYSGRP